MREDIEKIKENLIQQRDEMRLKMNLAKMEAKDEWLKVEEMLDHFVVKLENASEETKEVSEDVWQSMKSLGEEIKSGFERVKNQL